MIFRQQHSFPPHRVGRSSTARRSGRNSPTAWGALRPLPHARRKPGRSRRRKEPKEDTGGGEDAASCAHSTPAGAAAATPQRTQKAPYLPNNCDLIRRRSTVYGLAPLSIQTSRSAAYSSFRSFVETVRRFFLSHFACRVRSSLLQSGQTSVLLSGASNPCISSQLSQSIVKKSPPLYWNPTVDEEKRGSCPSAQPSHGYHTSPCSA